MEDQLEMIKVLLVDDDPEEVELTLEVMEMTNLKLDITVKSDGIEAMEYLEDISEKDGENYPDLILLDLNMPRMSGHELTRALKANKSLKSIPLVVLTTSKSESDRMKSYSDGASCYLNKPVGLGDFQRVVNSIGNFWFTVVKYPISKN